LLWVAFAIPIMLSGQYLLSMKLYRTGKCSIEVPFSTLPQWPKIVFKTMKGGFPEEARSVYVSQNVVYWNNGYIGYRSVAITRGHG
jgi:hypothetical protein